MRKLLTLFAAVLFVGSMWGESLTLTNSQIQSNASGKGSYGSYTIDGNWGGKWMINNNKGTYSLQLGYNTDKTKSAYNSHLAITMPDGASNISILIETQNGTASGRTFYACNANDKGTASSGDYGSASTSAQNGSATISITGTPSVIYVYPNGTAYLKAVTVSYETSEPGVGTITPEPTSVSVTSAAVNGAITIAYDGITDMDNVDDVALYNDADHTIAFTGEWLTAEWHDDNKTSIDYTIAENTGAARTAYIYLYAIDDNTNDVEKVIEVTQAAAPVDPTISFRDSTLDVGYTLDLSELFTSNSEGSVTYSITEGGSYATLNGKILTGVAVGNVTVQASQAAATGYNAKSISNTITVQEHVVTPGSYDIALSNTFFGCSTGSNGKEQTASKNDVTFVAGCISTAQNKTYYDAGHVRFYNESYLHISAPEGYVIDTIIFTAGGTWNGGISANVGTYDASDKKWTGGANEVDFSFTAQDRISSVHVHYDIAQPALILSTNALDFGSVVKDASVAAQTFTLSGENLEDAHAVTLVAPSGFTVSPTSITPSSGSISAQTITVTPITSAVGTFDGNLTISSDDLDADSIVALSLTVTAAVVNVTSVELDKTSISIEEGETETLTATVLPVDATNKAVTWESSDEDIATVDDGVVTAVAKGSATITCKSVADPTKLATCEVTVTGPDVVLDFTTNVWGFTVAPTKTVDEDEYTDGEYSIKVAGSTGNGYYFDTDNLMIGKKDAYITLPVFADKAIAKIITLGVTGGSGSVTFNVFQGKTAVSTGVESCKVDQTFSISPKKVNQEYQIQITNTQNARFSKILIYYGEADPIYAVNCAAAENGSVSADKASACAGETVTLTLTPDAGYKVASVIVNGGDPLAVTENQATFEMPAAIANVVATFSVATALDNTEVEGKAVKVLRNGILLIEKNGHTYNAMGQLVK